MTVDFGSFPFAFMMAIITNSLMIFVMFLLRKSRSFANIFGVGFMLLLYVLCILRMIMPLEFPDIQIILRDEVFYASVVDFFEGRSPLTSFLPFNFVFILLLLWGVAVLILTVRLIVKEARFKQRVAQFENIATESEKKILEEVIPEVFGKRKNITLIKTKAVNESFTAGYFQKKILLPDIEFDEEELRMILRHECCHIKNRDIWVKLLIEIYCIIFCWNPVSYLLKVDINDTLENRCDLSVVKDFGDLDRLRYAQTVVKFMAKEKNHEIPFTQSRFAQKRSNAEAKRRIMAILGIEIKKAKQIFLTVIVSILFVGLFVVSYLFIWQPFIGDKYLSEEDFEGSDDGMISDEGNSYLIHQKDGSYVFYFGNVPVETVSPEDIENGLYDDYPVYDE